MEIKNDSEYEAARKALDKYLKSDADERRKKELQKRAELDEALSHFVNPEKLGEWAEMKHDTHTTRYAWKSKTEKYQHMIWYCDNLRRNLVEASIALDFDILGVLREKHGGFHCLHTLLTGPLHAKN